MAATADPPLSPLRATAALLLSAFLLFLGTGLEPLWWATWLAPLPALLAAHRGSRWTAVAVCAGAWLLAGAAGIGPYLFGTLRLPLVVCLLAIANPAWHFALAALLSRALTRRGQFAAAALAVPALWTALDHLDALLSPHGTFGNLAYSQSAALPIMQLASATGIWGIDFLLMLPASVLAVALAHRPSRRWNLAAAASTSIVLALALGLGEWRLAMPPGRDAITVAMIAGDVPELPALPDDPATAARLATMEQRIAEAAAAHAALVALPETIVRLDATTRAAFEQRMQSLADRHGLMIVIGADVRMDDGARNAALVFRPHAPSLHYTKRHLIPGIEHRFTRGTTPLTFATDHGVWGVAICKDLDFPALGREYAAHGVALLAVPAWDFRRDGALHARMAAMRGIEGGFAIVRAARNGRMTLTDARGRIIAERPSGDPAALLLGRVAPSGERTLYARFGDWFAVCAWGLLAGCVLAPFVRRRRRNDVAH